MTQFTYHRTTDGTEDCFTISTKGGRNLALIHFWDNPGEKMRAEADAKLIVAALNAYQSK